MTALKKWSPLIHSAVAGLNLDSALYMAERGQDWESAAFVGVAFIALAVITQNFLIGGSNARSFLTEHVSAKP